MRIDRHGGYRLALALAGIAAGFAWGIVLGWSVWRYWVTTPSPRPVVPLCIFAGGVGAAALVGALLAGRGAARRLLRPARLRRLRRMAGTAAGIAGCLVWTGLLCWNMWQDWPADRRGLGALLLGVVILCMTIISLCGFPLFSNGKERPARDHGARSASAPRAARRPAKGRMPCALLLSALGVGVLAGCERKELEYPEQRRPLIVYMAVDNNLSDETSSRLQALRAGWRPGMEVWIYADTPQGASLSHLEADTEGVEARTVESYGEENSASGEVLERTLRTVWERCPAQGYGLLFFSHATGWLPQGALERPLADAATPQGTLSSRSIGRDGTQEIALDEFASALPEGMPLDYIVFEACLMAGAEVALELADKTEAVLASSAELLVPGFRPLYDEILDPLTSKSGSATDILATLGTRYMAYVRSERTGAYRSATLSVIRPAAMPALATAAREATAGEAGNPATAEWLETLQHFDRPGQYGDRPAAARFFDLEEYVTRLANDSGATTEALERFRAALREAVVWADATETFMGGVSAGFGGFDIACHSGLTVYVPRAEFPELNESYKTTAWWRTVNGNAYE